MVIEDHIHIDGQMTLTDRLISSVTGVAPLIVASSVLVGNLNADMLDGYHASAFAEAVNTYTKNESNSRYVGLEFNSNGFAEQSSGNVSIDAQHGNKIVYSDFWTGVVPDGLFSNSGFLRVSESDWFGHQEFMGYGDAWFFRPKELEGNWSWPWFQIATREWTTANYYNKTQNDARYATAAHTHAAGDITSGTFAIGRIPTGNTSVTVSLGNHTHAILTRGTGLTGSNYNGGAGTTWAVAFGTTIGTVAQGNDSRIINGQTAFSWGNHALAGYASSTHTHSANEIISGEFNIARIPTGTTSSTVALGNHTHAQLTPGAGLTGSAYNGGSGTTWAVLFGSTPGTVAEGNDSRIINGQTAFSWGNHATQGYLHQWDIETDYLPIRSGDYSSIVFDTETSLNTYETSITYGSWVNSPAPVPGGFKFTLYNVDEYTGFQQFLTNGDNWYFRSIGAEDWDVSFFQVATRQWGNDTFYTKAVSDLRFASISHTHAFSAITGKPTTLAGYGITNAYTKTEIDSAFAPILHTHTFASLTSKPTTIAGYGITDVLSNTTSITINGSEKLLSSNPVFNVGTLTSVGISMPTGFSVSNTPVTGSSGVLDVGFAAGYSLPTTAKQTQWDTAYNYSQAGHLAITNISDGGKIEVVSGLSANRLNSGILYGNWLDNTPSGTSPIGTLFTMHSSGSAGQQLYFAVGDSFYFRSKLISTWASWNKVASVAWVESQGYLTSIDVSGVYQPLDGDLTSIAGLSGTSGLLRKTAANTWELDTNNYSLSSHTHTFASLTSKPTTIAGYGITDAFTQTLADARYALLSHTHALLTIGTGLTGTNYNGSSASTIAINFGTTIGTVAQGNDSRILNGQTAFGWGNHALVGYLKNADVSGVYQPLDGDLTSIAGLSGTTGLLRKTAANTWSLDTNSYSLTSHSHAFSELTGKPTTLAGYGITDAFTKAQADLLYSVLGHTHTFASLTAKPTTLEGYGITNAFNKTESDGRYVQGVAGNFLHAAGFAGSDYDLNTTNSIRAHGGSASYTNAPAMSVSASAYRTVLTFDGHSVNAYAGSYKGQIAFNSAGQFSFRHQVAEVWGGWTALTPQTRSISINGVSQNFSVNSSYTIDLQSVLNAGNSATGSQMSIQGNGGTTNHIGRFGANGGWLTLYNNTSFAGQFLPTIKGETVGQGTGLSLIGQGQDTYTNAAISISARNAAGTGTVISGKIFSVLNYTTERFALDTAGYTTATGYKTTSGTASQFLKANGTVDSTSYFPDNNDTWKYRGTYNAVDANTLVLPGWYDNGSGSPTSTNIPLVKAGFISTLPFRTSVFAGGVQEYYSAGSSGDSLSNRRFWRSYWSGTFYSWREYAAVDWVESQGFAKLPIASVDWLTVDVANPGTLKLNVSTTNAPSAAAWHGLWVPHNSTNTYGTAIAFRNGAASIKSKENGIWNSTWNLLITQSILNGRVLNINGTGYNLGSSQVINVGDVNSFGAKTEGALTAWDASGQLISTGINVVGNTYTLGPANNTVKTIKFNYGSNEVGFQISNWSSAASMGPHAAIYTGSNGAPDGYGRLALVARPTDDSNGRIDFRVGSARGIKMYLNYNGDLNLTGRFYSTVATGQSPLVVSSQTVVSNLNADLLDGLHAADFLQVASANAYVYRANWGGMDANTMYTQSGWWANNDGTTSGSNFPHNQASIFEFLRNPLGSNSGVQEHTVIGGATGNRGRKYWRTVHGGAFTAWQEYLSAEKAALTYVTITDGDFRYGVRSQINIWNGSVNHFAPVSSGGFSSVNNSISIFRRTGDDEGTSIRGIDKDGIEAWRLRNNDATAPKTNFQLSLENGQIAVPGGNSNEWNTAFSVVQNLSANVAPPRFRAVGIVYIPKNQSFSEDIDLSQLLISIDNLADLRILHIDNAFYSDKGIAAMNSGVAGDLTVHLSGSISISVPENYNPIEIIVENTTNGRQSHVPLRVATIEYTNVIPAWMAKIGITYLLSSHESTIHFDTSRDVESRVLAQGGQHPSGLDHDSQPWNSMVWNPGTTEWVMPGYTELGRYNPTPAQMGTGGLQPDTNYTLEFREPTNPLIIYRVPFKTPNADVITTPQSILGGGSLPACTLGPDLMSVSNVTQTGLTWQFDGNGVTHIKWRIKSSGSTVREGNAYPSSSIVSISFDLLQPGNYVLEIEGGNCSSPVDSESFTISGGQATGFYLQLFRDGVQINSQWNGGSMPVPANHFTVKFIKPSSPNYGAITYFWEVKINNLWQPAHFFLNHSGTTGWVGGGFLASTEGDRFLVPDMIENTTPRSIYFGAVTDSPSMNPKRVVTDPAEFRLVIQVRSGNTSSPITETKYYNLQLTTSGGGVPVEAGYNEQVITSPNSDWKATFTTGRKTQWSINNNGEITDNYPDNYNGSTRRLMVDGIWQNVHYMVNMHWYDNIINLKLPEGNFSITKLYAPEDITKEAININTAVLEARLTQDADHLTEIKIEQVSTGIGLE